VPGDSREAGAGAICRPRRALFFNHGEDPNEDAARVAEEPGGFAHGGKAFPAQGSSLRRHRGRGPFAQHRGWLLLACTPILACPPGPRPQRGALSGKVGCCAASPPRRIPSISPWPAARGGDPKRSASDWKVRLKKNPHRRLSGWGRRMA